MAWSFTLDILPAILLPVLVLFFFIGQQKTMAQSKSVFKIMKSALTKSPPTFPAQKVFNRLAMRGRFANGESSGPLFVWAASRFGYDYDAGLHPHQGFEIHGYIFEGGADHFDTASNAWVPIKPGGVLVQYTNSGVQHAEKVLTNTRAFQIWFDPDFSKSLQEPADYKVFTKEDFNPSVVGGLKTTNYVGGSGGVINTKVEGLRICAYENVDEAVVEMRISAGEVGRTGIFFVLKGELTANGEALVENDSVILYDDKDASLVMQKGAIIFYMSFPEKPKYPLVAERF